MEKRELLQAISDNRLADYVSSNYWMMSKEELKALTVQLLFTMYDNGLKADKIDVEELLESLYLD